MPEEAASEMEGLRAKLPREYGFEIEKEELAFYLRVPYGSVMEMTVQSCDIIIKALRPWRVEIRRHAITAIIMADQDFIELDVERFLALTFDRDVNTLREYVSEVLKRIDSGRDARLRKMINQASAAASRNVLDSVPGSGRASTRLVISKRGRVSSYRPGDIESVVDIAINPTIRTAIMRGADMGHNGRLEVLPSDIQENIRQTRINSAIGVVVDMSTYDEEVKGQTISLMKSLFLDVYERRDRIGLVISKGDRAFIASDFTNDLETLRVVFMETPWGGLSPFASGVMAGARLFRARFSADSTALRIMVIITTGRANVPLIQGGNVYKELSRLPYIIANSGVRCIVVDVTNHGSRYLRDFAMKAGGQYYHPMAVRYHKEVLARRVLSSLNSGQKEKMVQAGRAFLEKLKPREEAATAQPGTPAETPQKTVDG